MGRSGPWRKSMRTHEFVQSNECEAIHEMRAARETIGEGWFSGGATLAEAIRRKCSALEGLARDEDCAECARLALAAGVIEAAREALIYVGVEPQRPQREGDAARARGSIRQAIEAWDESAKEPKT